jgi:DNA-binding CsgD family transcriptional regulator
MTVGRGHGRHAVGVQVAGAKLSERNVRRVRELGGLLTQREIGTLFGIHHRTVYDIQRRATWRHVT